MIEFTISAVQFSPWHSDVAEPNGWSLRWNGGTIQVTAARYPCLRSKFSHASGKTCASHDRASRIGLIASKATQP